MQPRLTTSSRQRRSRRLQPADTSQVILLVDALGREEARFQVDEFLGRSASIAGTKVVYGGHLDGLDAVLIEYLPLDLSDGSISALHDYAGRMRALLAVLTDLVPELHGWFEDRYLVQRRCRPGSLESLGPLTVARGSVAEGAASVGDWGVRFGDLAARLGSKHELFHLASGGVCAAHGDLHPGNIVVDGSRGGELLLVDLDRVVSLGVRGPRGPVSAQERGHFQGHRGYYYAPEAILAGGACDGRADVFSLALVFCRVVLDLWPFRAASYGDLLALAERAVGDAVDHTALAAAAGDPALAAALAGGLSIQPKMRPTMTEWAEALWRKT